MIIKSKLKYHKWCRNIAESNDINEIISHFREHAYEHFNRHNHEGELGLKIWLTGVFNFLHILENKFTDITTDDLLFKLCSYYKDHKKGPEPSFDVDEFMKKYKSGMKDYYYKYQASKDGK